MFEHDLTWQPRSLWRQPHAENSSAERIGEFLKRTRKGPRETTDEFLPGHTSAQRFTPLVRSTLSMFEGAKMPFSTSARGGPRTAPPSIDAMLPALPMIGSDLGVESDNDNQLIISVLFLGLAFGQMIYGPLSDSTGRKPAVLLGFALYGIGCLLSIIAGGLRAGLRDSRDPRRRTASCFDSTTYAITFSRCAQTSSPVLAPPTRPLSWRNGISGRDLAS